MNKQQQLFLDTYKKLEGLLRDQNLQVKDYEETLPEDKASKLRLCRNLRNFLSHETDGAKYVDICPNLQAFIEDLIWTLDEGEMSIKRKIKPILKGCNLQTPLVDCIELLYKKNLLQTEGIPIFDKENYIGLFTKDTLNKSIKNGKYPTNKSNIKSFIDYLDKTKLSIVNENDTFNFVKNRTNGKPVLVEKENKIIGYLL